jgi:very-short-patch-repair endonuclease/ribosomal protein S18 acetylase RimI-like enzyme
LKKVTIEVSESNIDIIEFRDELAVHFKDLNVAWLQKYFYVEPIDEEMLSYPKKYIIDKGGFIFFAEVNDVIAGTFALMKVEDDGYELSKMTVDEKFQGQKIGNKMMEFAIENIKNLGAKKLILFSNTLLGPAIHLYRKYGFVEVPLENSEYKRSNIRMELALTPDPSPTELERGEVSYVEEPYPKYGVRNAIQYDYAQNNRRESTEAEGKLWELLRNSKLGVKFRRQHPIENFIVDFACLEKGLIVEVDGVYHDNQEQQELDKYRTQLLHEKGFTVLRFANEEILQNVYVVRDKIKQALKELEKQK